MESPERFDDYDEAGEGLEEDEAVEPLTDEELAEGAGTGIEEPPDEELEDRGDV